MRFFPIKKLFLGTEHKKSLQDEKHIVVSMFISSENGIKMHNLQPIDADSRLIEISTPYIIILEKLALVKEVLGDFAGLEKCDKNTKEAVLDFSYYLSLGE